MVTEAAIHLRKHEIGPSDKAADVSMEAMNISVRRLTTFELGIKLKNISKVILFYNS